MTMRSSVAKGLAIGTGALIIALAAMFAWLQNP